MLPVAAVDEQERRTLFARFKKVDTIAFARTVSEVEMIGISFAHFSGAPLPAGNDVGAISDGHAVVEAAITLFLIHAAPVRRVERRSHAQISNRDALSAFPLCRKMFYRTTQSAKGMRNYGRRKWHLIRSWYARRRALSSIN